MRPPSRKSDKGSTSKNPAPLGTAQVMGAKPSGGRPVAAPSRPTQAPARVARPPSRPTQAPTRAVAPPTRPATTKPTTETPKGPVGTSELVRRIASEEIARATTPEARAEIRKAKDAALEEITRVSARREAPQTRQPRSPIERRLREILGRNMPNREPRSPVERRLREFFRSLRD